MPLIVWKHSRKRRLFSSSPPSPRLPPSPLPDSAVHLYNSLTGSIESIPTNTPIACYTCGPTVYAPSHLGHARTYLWVDVLRRLLEHTSSASNSKPLFVMNITNVDDKILQASQQNPNVSALQLALKYEQSFWDDLQRLNCLRPQIVTRVTDYMESHIVPFIEELLEQGFAYQCEDGIYFSVAEYERKTGKPYRLFQRHVQEEEEEEEKRDNANIPTESATDNGLLTKRHPSDFALWKQRKPGETMYWKGPDRIIGRPGWHIECSAMIRAIQQEIHPIPFYLHIGGIDLKFPHHTNEVAQSQALCCHLHQDSHNHHDNNNNNNNNTGTSSEWIPHWMHTGHLHIDGLKMSKSLKNFISIEEYITEANSSNNDSPLSSPGDDLRWWCLQSSYRAPSTFSTVQLEAAKQRRMKVIRFLVAASEQVNTNSRLMNYSKWSTTERDMELSASHAREACVRALCNDLDGATFCNELITLVDKGMQYLQQSKVCVETIQSVSQTVRDLCSLVGFSDITSRAGLTYGNSLSVAIGGERAVLDSLVTFRSSVRKEAITQLKHDKSNQCAQEMLKLCDDARKTLMTTIGVELLDGKETSGGPTSSWKPCLTTVQNLDDNASLERDILHTNASLDDLLTIPVDQFFKVGAYKGLFLEYDGDNIMPTVNADGSEVSNRQHKKLQKKLDKHKKRLGLDTVDR